MAAASPSPSSSSSSPIHLLATSSDVVKSWELNRDAALTARQEFEVPGNGQGPWHCVRWNHNSQVIAAGHDTGAIALLHESGKVLEVLHEPSGGNTTSRSGAPTPVLSLAWGGRSRYLCTSGADHCPSLWDLKKKERIKAFRGHQYPVTAVAFASDDLHVASGNNHGEILLHRLTSEEPAMVLPLDLGGGNGGGAPLTPSASIAAAVRSVNYWAMRQPLLLAGYRNGDARVWDTTAGTCVTSFKGQHQAAITAVVGSTVNNKLLATAGLDRRVILVDVNSRKLLRECKAVAPINDMTFNAEGDMILVACTNGSVSSYDLRKPTIPCYTVQAHPGVPVRSLAVQNHASRAAAVVTPATKTVGTASAQSTAAAASTTRRGSVAPPAPPKTPVKTSEPVKAVVAPKAPSPRIAAPPPPTSTPQPRPSSSLPASSTSTSSTTTSTARPILASASPSLASPSSSAKPTTTTTAPAAAQRAASPRDEEVQPMEEEEEEEEEEDAQPPQPQIKRHPPASSSFSWRDKGTTSSTTTTSNNNSSSEASSRNAAAAAAAAAAVAFTTSSKEMTLQMENKMKDMVADLRDELAVDLRGLHLELLRTAETTQVAMQGLAATFQALVDENKALRQEVEVLQQQMEMPF